MRVILMETCLGIESAAPQMRGGRL
jgi:hypothetical protein